MMLANLNDYALGSLGGFLSLLTIGSPLPANFPSAVNRTVFIYEILQTNSIKYPILADQLVSNTGPILRYVSFHL